MNLIRLLTVYWLPSLLASSVWAQDVSTVTYSADNQDIANPERGFYTQNWQFPGERLSADYLRGLREQENVTLIRVPFRVPDFRNKPFDQEVLQTMEAAFNAAREAGMKVIPRIAYSYGKEEPDAPLDIVLQHIGQIKPILRKHADVIAFMNAGFIGAWGEWHSSSNGLAEDNRARQAILFALLDALPPERTANLRYNYHKRAVFGTDEPLTNQEAFNGSDRARTGAHNDCFRASFYDLGTYTWQGDIEGEKDYLNKDNRFVPQSGETCGQSEYSGCVTSLEDLERMRWDALNREFDENVLNDWRAQGCYGTVQRKLGYRFVLKQAEFPAGALQAGQTFRAKIQLRNEGWGKAYNPRGLELILRDKMSSKVVRIPLDQDPRRWLPDDGLITLDINQKLPTALPAGSYELLLNLPDPVPSLYGNPAYSIRMANQSTWESSTGFNKLNATVRIDSNSLATQTYTVRARGLQGTERLALQISGQTVKTWTVGTTMQDYTYTGPERGTPRLAFTNDQGKNHDLQVDKLTVDGTVYQTEAQAINTGVWQQGSCGGSYSEWLHCGGYVQFALAENARRADQPSKRVITDEAVQVYVYPNPSSTGDLIVRGIEAKGSQVMLLTLQGQRIPVTQRIVDSHQLRLQPQVAVSQGLYIIRVQAADGTTSQHRILVAPTSGPLND